MSGPRHRPRSRAPQKVGQEAQAEARAGGRPGRAAETVAPRAAALVDLRPPERLFVEMLRHWLEGPAGQAAVWNGLARSMGPAAARELLEAFEGFLHGIAGLLRRRLVRHRPHCPCLGPDEALLAALLSGARRGDAAAALAAARALVAERDVSAVLAAALRLEVAMRLGADLAGAGQPQPGLSAARPVLH